MLETAIALAKAGDKQAARLLLRQIVASEPDNERASGWLVFCAETLSERREALKHVLEINPDNQGARRALDELGDRPLHRPSHHPPRPSSSSATSFTTTLYTASRATDMPRSPTRAVQPSTSPVGVSTPAIRARTSGFRLSNSNLVNPAGFTLTRCTQTAAAAPMAPDKPAGTTTASAESFIIQTAWRYGVIAIKLHQDTQS
jgi:hypothetical protein